MNGVVKFFNAEKRYGFIKGDDGVEYFVHISEVENGAQLRDEQAVEFEPHEDDRGKKATKVKVIQE